MDLSGKYRLVTRSDFDGLVCAVLFNKMNINIEKILFVHPKDMQDKIIELTENDITTNLPYVEDVYLSFDHHYSETIRVGQKKNCIIDSNAPSTARVIYEYFKRDYDLSSISNDLLNAVDKADSGHFTMEDVLNPTGWELLNFIMDPRTGLGRFHNFRISNYDLMMELIAHCNELSIDEILSVLDVKERVDLYFEMKDKYVEQIKRVSTVRDNLLVIDLREEDTIYSGNRFMPYAIFPEVNISMHIMWGRDKKNVVCALGKSIFNRDSEVNIGLLALEYGGGGHPAAGTCQLDIKTADANINKIINSIIGLS